MESLFHVCVFGVFFVIIGSKLDDHFVAYLTVELVSNDMFLYHFF